MKYLVYLLIGLNVAYFAWHWSRPPQVLPAPQVAPLPADVESLVLLSERKRKRLATTAPDTGPDETEPVVEASAESVESVPEDTELPPAIEVLPACRTVGPITARDEAAGLRGQLLQQGYPAVLREGEVQVPSGYQVYLSAMSSRQAREIVSQLEAAGMTDYFVGRNNRISLGIFSNKGKAQTRQQAVRLLGYDPMLNARYKARKVYWVDIEERDRVPGQSGGWQQILASYPGLRARQVSCE